MSDQEVNFEILNLPIPCVIKTYSKEKQQDIFNYLYDKYYTIIEQCKA